MKYEESSRQISSMSSQGLQKQKHFFPNIETIVTNKISKIDLSRMNQITVKA